eukprot:TRINITY_DN75193_c0_g1_i1.p1 TRINITY_DN75193_c0_g1~~TRINITY_DN75193_c0_g1_i1.p1  ORF type:complete len:203 (-),score=43.51 TRINITY_DN75193_c0_g1_i1:37-645(-)
MNNALRQGCHPLRHRKTWCERVLLIALAFVVAARCFPQCFAGGSLGAPRHRRLSLQVIDYDNLMIQEVKRLLEERGLSATGRKAVLLERLKASDGVATAAAGAPTAGSAEGQEESSGEDKQAANPYVDEHGRPIPDADGKYMCLDGVARSGDWEKAKRENPDDLNWLTEWVVAARTGQVKRKIMKNLPPEYYENANKEPAEY